MYLIFFEKNYTYQKKLMNWKHTLIIVVSILSIGIGLGYLISYSHQDNRKLQQQIIDTERKAIDSLHKEISGLREQREEMESQLETLNKDIKKSETNLSSKINQLKIQNNVKIDSIVNSSNDQLLIGLRKRFGAN